jgi:hypothetical protein
MLLHFAHHRMAPLLTYLSGSGSSCLPRLRHKYELSARFASVALEVSPQQLIDRRWKRWKRTGRSIVWACARRKRGSRFQVQRSMCDLPLPTLNPFGKLRAGFELLNLEPLALRQFRARPTTLAGFLVHTV